MNLDKNMLAGALTALGKLICRTSEEVIRRSLILENRCGEIAFHTCSQNEQLEFSCASDDESEFCKAVSFEDFRNAVRGGRNKEVTLELKSNGVIFVNGTVVPEVTCDIPALIPIPASAVSVDLPDNFMSMLCHAAATTADRSDPRRTLCGIHLDKTGITTTNSKELLHIPFAWQIPAVNLPFPLALINTKANEKGKMWLWEKEEKTFFHISVGSWSWRGQGITGAFPDWQQIITSKPLPYVVQLSAENALQLQNILKSLPDMPPNNPVSLSARNKQLVVTGRKDCQSTLPAEFSGNWKEYSVTVNKDYLLRALLLGHLQFGFRESKEPFMASGGVGQYTGMPLLITSSHPVKEEKQMENNSPNAVAVSAPPAVISSKSENNVSNLNPLDELVTVIEEFRTKLKLLSDETALLSRKAKEVSLVQKQKERDFIQAKRAIERIRMAI